MKSIAALLKHSGSPAIHRIIEFFRDGASAGELDIGQAGVGGGSLRNTLRHR
jgi:hypothetical protein